MRFTVEQIFLADPREDHPQKELRYHLVEADTVDHALAEFLRMSEATLVGTVQKYPGLHAMATARTSERVFTINLLPGSDTFHLQGRGTGAEGN